MALQETDIGTADGELFGEPVSELLVQQVAWEADGVVSLRLVHADGRDLPSWKPGAHVDLILPSGLIRQYSLCGDVNDRKSYRLGVLREPASRGGSKEIHETALVGRLITVRGPRNHFELTDAKRFLFIGGGIGITPMLPMVAEASRRNVPWTLVYGGRSRKTMAFLDEIAAFRGGEVDIVPEDERGFPDLDAILKAATSDTDVFACGPPAMLSAIEERCQQYLAPGVLHIERFTAPEGAAEVEEGENTTFEVELARRGITLTVPPDKTLLKVIREAVPTVLYSCEDGYCGTCETRVLEGVCDHRDTILSEEERAANNIIMICVSRSKSPKLVLDI